MRERRSGARAPAAHPSSPFDALAHVLEGEAEIRISGIPLRVKACEMVLMPANQPHALTAITKFKMLLTMIRS